MNWMTWVLFVGLVWIYPGKILTSRNDTTFTKLRNCFTEGNINFVVPDNFNGVINASKHWNQSEKSCVVFLQRVENINQSLRQEWPQIKKKNGDLLYISKRHIDKKVHMYVLRGRDCNATVPNLEDNKCVNGTECQVTCLHIEAICNQSTYDEEICNSLAPSVKDKYIINMTEANKSCLNCNNPLKKPEMKLDLNDLNNLDISLDFEEGEEVIASEAAEIMEKMSLLATYINTSSAELTLGEGVTGILVKETEPEDVEEVSFAYSSPKESINIIEGRETLASFSRSVTVPKEAFEKSVKSQVSIPFAAIFRFTNMTINETDRNVLGNEVLAIEMGAMIENLTDKIYINFRNVTYEGTPSCQSWNGEGNWTDVGCLTKHNGEDIICQCSHLTFFAILLAPPNETLSSSDLNNLTAISQAGCGLSMFFLGIILFMHFILRKTKPSVSIRFFIQLVSAMFLLNLTFLTNHFVADLKNSVGCKIMGALMHYFMLATFTWFAVQAFHLCLQLHTGGKVVIRHYILKVSITSWALPSLVGIILLIKEKYGEQVITTNDNEKNVSMCWITDITVHYVVNIGYYALVFFFTLTTFIIIVYWLFCLKTTNAGSPKTSVKSITIILGLCCMLGITWGFAFLAHGIFRIPAYYIFTVLNSFQGFFLFIYYYKTSHLGEINGGERGNKTSNTSSSNSTLKTKVDSYENPYSNIPGKK